MLPFPQLQLQGAMSFKRPTRREFLVAGSTAALAAAVPATNSDAVSPANAASTEAVDRAALPFSAAELFQPNAQRTFSGDRATQVSMPVGGLGAGCICVNGSGGLQDFSIRTRPETTALPTGFTANSPEAGFAILHIKGATPVTKLVEGPFPAFKIFDQGLRVRACAAAAPKDFRDSRNAISAANFLSPKSASPIRPFPSTSPSSAWNPFIPLDDKNSGIPCAILEYTLHNTSSQAVDYEFSYHLSHLAPGCRPDQAASANAVIPGKGAFLFNPEAPNAESLRQRHADRDWRQTPHQGHVAAQPRLGVRFPLALWREVSTGNFTPNDGSNTVDNCRPQRRFHPDRRTSRAR